MEGSHGKYTSVLVRTMLFLHSALNRRDFSFFIPGGRNKLIANDKRLSAACCVEKMQNSCVKRRKCCIISREKMSARI